MRDPSNDSSDLDILSHVEQAIQNKCKALRKTAEELFGGAIRTAIDEVVDGPRTGRWSLDQLSNPEKTYVGIKIEIVVRAELDLDPSKRQDAVIGGHDVNIKWSRTSAWMVGPENVGAILLVLGTDKASGRRFRVGLVHAHREVLTPGMNRDKKQSLSSRGVKGMRWIVKDATLPSNFVEELPAEVRKRIFAERSAQARVRALVTLVPNVPIPRQAFCTVALDKDDPMRRLRQDKHNSSGLGGLKVYSARYGRKELARRGLPALPRDHFIALPDEE